MADRIYVLGRNPPLLALSRTVEIDLMQQLDEKGTPEPEAPKEGVLL